MAPPPAAHRLRTHGFVALAGIGAFAATLAIPAVAALWWLLAAATVAAVASLAGIRLRRAGAPSPGAAGARDR